MEDAPEKLTMYKLVFCSRQLIATFVRFQNSARVALCQPGVASWWSVHVDHQFSLYDDMTFHQYVLSHLNHGPFEIDVSVDHRTGDPWLCQGRRVVSSVLIPRPAIAGICQMLYLRQVYIVES
jgi:hypothetical protein